MKLSLIATVVLALAAAAQDKTYELKMEWKPVKGYKTELDESSAMKMTLKMTGQPEAMNMAEDTAFSALETVVSADGAGGSERTWKFSKATSAKEGAAAPLGFQGKTVVMRHVKGKSRDFSLEGGGEIAADDLTALKKAFMGSEEKEGKPSGAEMFAPKKPVKVGESWSPDLKILVSGMFDEEMSGAVDLEKSKTLFTLKSVETRDGAEFGKIEGMMELSLGQMGPMKLETPILFKVSLTADACIDGKLPDGVLVMKAEMKGKSAAAGPSGKIELDLDMTATGKKTAKTAK